MASTDTRDFLDVWVDDHLGVRHVGVLERVCESGLAYQARIIFHYNDGLADTDAISLTMPIRRLSYLPKVAGLVGNLPPVFDQNIPEGVLRDYLTRRYLKIVPDMGDFDLLRLAGSRSIGRIRVIEHGAEPNFQSPQAPSVHSLLVNKDAEKLLESLFEQLAQYSGVSGVQPKVLIEDTTTIKPSGNHRITLVDEGYIVKSSGDNYPWLTINEHVCLHANMMSGLNTAETHLSDDGTVLAIKRFDRDAKGHPLGLEDMACLSALTSRDKYQGSYENMVQLLGQMLNPDDKKTTIANVFKSIVLSCVLGNGDAHLKNFALLYADPTLPPLLAPAFDICCTMAYLPTDTLALTLGNHKYFPGQLALNRFGRISCQLSPKEIETVFQDVALGVEYAATELNHYCKIFPDFGAKYGAVIRHIWTTHMQTMLGLPSDYVLPADIADVGRYWQQT